MASPAPSSSTHILAAIHKFTLSTYPNFSSIILTCTRRRRTFFLSSGPEIRYEHVEKTPSGRFHRSHTRSRYPFVYLWVDAAALFWIPLEDWNVEAAQMVDVYRGAYSTISGAQLLLMHIYTGLATKRDGPILGRRAQYHSIVNQYTSKLGLLIPTPENQKKTIRGTRWRISSKYVSLGAPLISCLGLLSISQPQPPSFCKPPSIYQVSDVCVVGFEMVLRVD